MKIYIEDEDLKELIETGTSTSNKFKRYVRNKKFMEGLNNVVGVMHAVQNTQGLKAYSFLHYERLKYRPESSVRIVNNMVERLLFLETEDGIEITIIEINDDHYGNKK